MNSTTTMQKPPQLRQGDKLAILSPSWGGPSLFPHVLDAGLQALRVLGFTPVEFPTARMDAQELYNNPRIRAEDINKAFGDPEIRGIIASIGGTDSARILKYLDPELIRANPKFFMGFSDTTTLNTYLNQLGLVSFNGPSVMAGFAQWPHFSPEYRAYIRDFLLNPAAAMTLPVFPSYCNGYESWGVVMEGSHLAELVPNEGLRFIQGSGKVSGTLFGGCIEVLEMLKGTEFWLQPDFWNGKILFLETSEDKPSVDYVQFWLRNYGVMGVFDRVSGILFGRPRDYSDEEKRKLEQRILTVVRDEFGNSDLPIVCNVDFGHTDPQLILPLGIDHEIDCQAGTITQVERAFGD